MKKFYLNVIAATAAVCVCLDASAFKVGDVSYGIVSSTAETAKVTGVPNTFKGALEIPQTVEDSSTGKVYTVVEIANYAFDDTEGLVSVSFPASVTKIGNYVFDDCIALESVTLPESLQKLGSSVFYNCKALKEVTIPAEIKLLEANVFGNCTGLTKITIPAAVTTINGRAFEGCTGLTDLEIGAGVTYMGSDAFGSCDNLRLIVSLAVEYPFISASSFSEKAYASAEVIVPNGSLDNYKKGYWSKFVNLKEAPNTSGVFANKADSKAIKAVGRTLQTNGKAVTVYTYTGAPVYSGVADEVALDIPGIYIVKPEGGKAVKIVVR